MDLDDHEFSTDDEGDWTLEVYLYGYEDMEEADLTI